MRAALYARVSTDEQGGNHSIPAQLDVTRQQAERQGYTIVDVYQDIASGGTTDRPELRRLLLDVKDNKIDVVIAKNSDRIARGVEVLIPIQTILERAGCKLQFVEESYDDSPISQGMLQIRAVMSGIERLQGGLRTRSSLIQMAKEGKQRRRGQLLHGYGQDAETQAFVIDPERAEVVRRIFAQYIDGKTPQAIARLLNVEGVPTSKADTGGSKGWQSSGVSAMLTVTAYRSEGWANKHYFVTVKGPDGKDKRKQLTRPREEWLPIPYPAIVDAETWDRAQARRKLNKREATYNRAGPGYLLRGLLWCSECKMSFACNTDIGRRVNGGKERWYGEKQFYRCGGVTRYPHLYNCREPKNLRADDIDLRLREQLSNAFSTPQFIETQLRQQQQASSHDQGRVAEDLRKAEDALRTLDKKRDKTIDLSTDGIIEKEELLTRLGQINEGRQHWTEVAERLRGVLLQAVDYEAVRDSVDRARDIYFEAESEMHCRRNARQMVQDLVSRVWVDREGNVTTELLIPGLAVASTGDDAHVGNQLSSPR